MIKKYILQIIILIWKIFTNKRKPNVKIEKTSKGKTQINKKQEKTMQSLIESFS